jgi:hypothetical protein
MEKRGGRPKDQTDPSCSTRHSSTPFAFIGRGASTSSLSNDNLPSRNHRLRKIYHHDTHKPRRAGRGSA